MIEFSNCRRVIKVWPDSRIVLALGATSCDDDSDESGNGMKRACGEGEVWTLFAKGRRLIVRAEGEKA